MNTNRPRQNGIRLNRYLAQCGLGSRRECDRLIESGAISINGARVTTLGTMVDPRRNAISFGAKKLAAALPLEYVAYHKSRGILVTASDPQGRETIYDALEKVGFTARHLKHAGRLDRNSEGLLFLTNDGELLHALTHPRFHIKKVYQVRSDRELDAADVALMVEEGVRSEGQVLRAGKVRRRDSDAASRGELWYEVELYEGKNRQIRRMFGQLGYEVMRLKRTQFGVLKLGGLKRGSYRHLEEREVMGLRKLGHSVHEGRRQRAGKKGRK